MKMFKLTELVALTICATIVAISFTGCGTTGASGSGSTNAAPEVDWQKVTASVVKIGAKNGVIVAVNKNIKLYRDFDAASLVIDLAIQNGEYDPAKLKESLDKLGVKDMLAKSAIDDFLTLYKDNIGQSATSQINQNVWASSLLTALRDGIRSGLRFAAVSNNPILATP